MDIGYKFIQLVYLTIRSPRLLSVVFIVSTLLLILPRNMLIVFGIDSLMTQFQSFIGLASIISFVILLTMIVSYYYKIREEKKQRDIILKRLDSLSIGEKTIFKKCIEQNQQNFTTIFNSSTAQSLCQKN